MADTTLTLSDSTQPTNTASPSVGSMVWNQAQPVSTQVYSADNMQQALSTTAARPNLSDPFGVYDFYMNSPDIQKAKAQSTQYYQDLLNIRNTNRQQQQSLQNLPQALNVIRGEQAVAGNQAALRESAVSDSLSASQAWLDTLTKTASDRYNIALNERSQLQDLIAQTGGKAKISYTDTYETALQKATSYLDKKAEKDSIKQLYFQTFGDYGKGKSSKQMQSKLKKAFKSDKKLEKQLNDMKMQSSQLDLQSQQLQLQQQRLQLQKLQQSLSTTGGYVGNIEQDLAEYNKLMGK